MSYTIIEKDGSVGIFCSTCKKTSYNPKDVEHKYCGFCHAFHERNDILHDAPPDRLINELYAWVVTESRSGPLEGLFGMSSGPSGEFQCVTTSKAMAITVGEFIKNLPYRGKRFKLVRFSRADVIEEL